MQGTSDAPHTPHPAPTGIHPFLDTDQPSLYNRPRTHGVPPSVSTRPAPEQVQTPHPCQTRRPPGRRHHQRAPRHHLQTRPPPASRHPATHHQRHPHPTETPGQPRLQKGPPCPSAKHPDCPSASTPVSSASSPPSTTRATSPPSPASTTASIARPPEGSSARPNVNATPP